MKKFFLISLFLCAATVLFADKAMALVFLDGFEGSTFNSFWEVFDANHPDFEYGPAVYHSGIAALSTDMAHSGTQSFLCDPFSQKGFNDAAIQHDFGQAMQGDVSVWLWDDGSQEIFGESYLTLSTRYTNLVRSGMNSNYPVYTYARVSSDLQCYYHSPRTAGWHNFNIHVDDNGTTWSIDNNALFSNPDIKDFSIINLVLTRDGNAKSYYFDDFYCNIEPKTPVTPVPEPLPLYLVGTGLFGYLAFRKRKLRNRGNK